MKPSYSSLLSGFFVLMRNVRDLENLCKKALTSFSQIIIAYNRDRIVLHTYVCTYGRFGRHIIQFTAQMTTTKVLARNM